MLTKGKSSILAMFEAALGAGLIVSFFGGGNSRTSQGDNGATTETTAAAAGARVLPTDPKLKVE